MIFIDYKINIDMLKLNLHIQWITLSYNSPAAKNHYVNIVLENQEAQQLIFERKLVSPQQNLYFLDNLIPFQFHMVVGQDKPILCPFQLTLISKHTPLITRIVPLKHADIFQHYLNHEVFSQIEPLSQSFIFEEGELAFKIMFDECETMKDVTEVQDLHIRLRKTLSMISEINIKGSQLTAQQPQGTQESKIDELEQRQDLVMTLAPLQKPQTEVKVTKRLKSFKSMSEMTIQQIAKTLETQQEKRYVQIQKESEMYETKRWYLKLGKQDEHDTNHDSHSGWSLKIKMLVALLLLGFFMLSYLILTGEGHNQSHSVKIRGRKRIPNKKSSQHVDH